MFVKDFMTPDPVTVAPENSLSDAFALLKEHNIRRLPVVSNGKLVGIVTENDLLKASPSEATTLSVWEMHYLLSRMKIADIMETDLVTVEEDAPLEKAAVLMKENDVAGLPVLNKSGELVGIITESDIFDALIDVMGLGEKGTRITVELENKPGTLLDVVRVIKDFELNIISVATFHGRSPDKREVVIRVSTTEPEELVNALSERGISVVHYEVF